MNSRMRGLLLITIVAALALAGSAGAQNPTLFGTVGPGFSIQIADGAGNPRHPHSARDVHAPGQRPLDGA